MPPATSSAWAPFSPSPPRAKRRSAADRLAALAYRAVYREVGPGPCARRGPRADPALPGQGPRPAACRPRSASSRRARARYRRRRPSRSPARSSSFRRPATRPGPSRPRGRRRSPGPLLAVPGGTRAAAGGGWPARSRSPRWSSGCWRHRPRVASPWPPRRTRRLACTPGRPYPAGDLAQAAATREGGLGRATRPDGVHASERPAATRRRVTSPAASPPRAHHPLAGSTPLRRHRLRRRGASPPAASPAPSGSRVADASAVPVRERVSEPERDTDPGLGRVLSGQCLKDWRLAWISGGGWVCG